MPCLSQLGLPVPVAFSEHDLTSSISSHTRSDIRHLAGDIEWLAPFYLMPENSSSVERERGRAGLCRYSSSHVSSFGVATAGTRISLPGNRFNRHNMHTLSMCISA
ncbi:hypothetical protein XPA_004621 [Xanthoria parietina]